MKLLHISPIIPVTEPQGALEQRLQDLCLSSKRLWALLQMAWGLLGMSAGLPRRARAQWEPTSCARFGTEMHLRCQLQLKLPAQIGFGATLPNQQDFPLTAVSGHTLNFCLGFLLLNEIPAVFMGYSWKHKQA